MLNLLLSERSARVMLLLLTIMGGAASLFLAKPILAPIVFGLVVGVVVSPVADKLSRYGIPRVIVALSALGTACLGIVAFFLALEPLTSSLVAKLPKIRAEMQNWAETLSNALRGIEELSAEIERTVGTESEIDLGESVPTVMDALLLAPNFGAQMLVFVGTLFFFVLARNDLYDNAGSFRDRLFRADRAVSRYFATVTLVNTGLGIATAFVLSVIGLENAILWGFAAGVLNFVIYLGPILVMVGLLIAGLMQFSGAMTVLPVFAFLCLNLTEAQFATPAVVGQQLRMSPLVIFIAIVFGLWLWGPIGAIVALPMLLWLYAALSPRFRLSHSPAPQPQQT
ncbi:AI-2E family transporter [Dinoroseobacter sp. S76]|uniref:AI-2E family transporter n=1 Tax=Dinoroseobacter sp. S76 TaxID=3415124 RepID=UPI003C7B091D